jgi:hypothetical protein
MFEAQRASVLTVGCGRGFIVESGTNRYVLTAAHCMVSGVKEDLPPCIAAAGAEELTYPKLLAPLGGHPWVSAQSICGSYGRHCRAWLTDRVYLNVYVPRRAMPDFG